MSDAWPRYPISLGDLRYQEAGRDYHVPRHSHVMWQWYCVIAGEVRMQIDDEEHLLRAGEHILVSPRRMRSPRCGGRSPRYAIGLFKSRQLPLDQIADKPWPTCDMLDEILRSLVEELRHPGPLGTTYRTCLMTHVLLLLLRKTDQSPNKSAPSRINRTSQANVVERAEAFMQGNLHRKLLRHQIASAVHLSPTHLARLFRSHRKQSIGQQLTAFRLEHARSLLLESDLSITQIARDVGFASFSHFTQTFRHHLGVSPSDLRRSRGLSW